MLLWSRAWEHRSLGRWVGAEDHFDGSLFGWGVDGPFPYPAGNANVAGESYGWKRRSQTVTYWWVTSILARRLGGELSPCGAGKKMGPVECHEQSGGETRRRSPLPSHEKLPCVMSSG
jgi:hypothetical protein